MRFKMIRKHMSITILICLFFIVNLIVLVSHPGNIFNQPERFGLPISTYGARDASLYAKMAWQIIHEGIYGYNATISNAYVTPGQPFYLVAIFTVAEWFHTNHIMLFRLANMLLNIMTALLIYMIAYKLFNKKVIGIMATLMYCTQIAPYHYFRTALTETPSIFLFLLSILVLIYALEKGQYRYHILFGIIASITLMFRPTPGPILLLAWAIVLYKYGFKEGVKIGFIWCIGPLLIMFPWVLRNYILFDHAYLFSSHAGNPLLGGSNPFYMENQGKLVQEAVSKGLSQEEYAKIRIKNGFMENFPLYFSWFTVGKTIWLFMDQAGFPDGIGPYRGGMAKVFQHFFIWQNALTVGLAFIFSVVYRKRSPLLTLILTVLFYIILSNIFLTIPRYGLLIFPILSIITAYGLYHTWNSAKEKLLQMKEKRSA